MSQTPRFEIPTKWNLVRLGDHLSLINGRAYKRSELLDEGTPVLRIQNLNGGDRWYYSDLDLPSDKYCEAGDLLFAWSATFGPYIWKGPKAIYHYHIWKVLPKDTIDPDYAFRMLEWITESVKAAAHGVTMVHITKGSMEDWQIPLPPLDEQRRIAAVLDAADALRAKRRAALAKLDTLLQSVFLEMFGDPVTNPMGWEVRKFEELITLDAPMVDPTLDEFRQLPHIGADRIEGETGKLLEARTAEEDGLISGKFLFDDRYVLYSKIRPYLRKVALPTFKGLCSADVYPVRPAGKSLTRELLYLILLSASFTRFTEQHSNRANIPKINRNQLLSFECYVPDSTIQRQFLSIFNALRAQVAVQEESLARMDSLFSVLQQRSFCGDL